MLEPLFQPELLADQGRGTIGSAAEVHGLGGHQHRIQGLRSGSLQTRKRRNLANQ